MPSDVFKKRFFRSRSFHLQAVCQNIRFAKTFIFRVFKRGERRAAGFLRVAFWRAKAKLPQNLPFEIIETRAKDLFFPEKQLGS
jgi:hypothetical protein